MNLKMNKKLLAQLRWQLFEQFENKLKEELENGWKNQ